MYWSEPLVYVILSLSSTGIVSIALLLVYRRYKRLQKKVVDLTQKLKSIESKKEQTPQPVKQLTSRRKINKEIIELVISLHRQGHSYRQIAKIVGISHTSVARIVKKYAELLDIPEDIPSAPKEESIVSV